MAEQKKKQAPKKRTYQIIIGVMSVVIVILFFSAARTTYLLDEERKLNAGQTQATASQEPAPEAKFEPITLSGSGNKATDPVTLSRGGYRITSTNSGGTSNFVVEMLDENGNQTDNYLVANDIGTSNTTKAVNKQAGKYFFNVMSDGDWTIKIEKL